MTDEELVAEFGRWVANGRGDIWYKNNVTKEWYTTYPTWDSTGHYITNDKYAEIKKLQIDEPVYEWIFYRVNPDKSVCMSKHLTDVENNQWIKIEETKRIRNG